jgi:hypothetical protein
MAIPGVVLTICSAAHILSRAAIPLRRLAQFNPDNPAKGTDQTCIYPINFV